MPRVYRQSVRVVGRAVRRARPGQSDEGCVRSSRSRSEDARFPTDHIFEEIITLSN